MGVSGGVELCDTSKKKAKPLVVWKGVPWWGRCALKSYVRIIENTGKEGGILQDHLWKIVNRLEESTKKGKVIIPTRSIGDQTKETEADHENKSPNEDRLIQQKKRSEGRNREGWPLRYFGVPPIFKRMRGPGGCRFGMRTFFQSKLKLGKKCWNADQCSVWKKESYEGWGGSH